MLSRFVPLFILMILCVPAAVAAAVADLDAELASANRAMSEGDYQKAYSRFKRHAASNPLAQFNLGLIEQNGLGRPVNQQEACRWFEKAAAGKIPTAQHFFGVCLLEGVDRPADTAAAIEWFKRAADGGHLMSLCSAGELYIEGNHIGRDVEQGFALCAQAAQMGVPLAMLTLADYYAGKSDAIPQDLTAARYWYTQAAEHRSPEGQYQLGLMLKEGRGGDPDPATALFWLETAASEGFVPAYLPTAILYANADTQSGTSVLAPEHLAKIYVWLMAAKARNSDPALATEITRMESMVMAVMPDSWKDSLDQTVAAHLARYRD